MILKIPIDVLIHEEQEKEREDEKFSENLLQLELPLYRGKDEPKRKPKDEPKPSFIIIQM